MLSEIEDAVNCDVINGIGLCDTSARRALTTFGTTSLTGGLSFWDFMTNQ